MTVNTAADCGPQAVSFFLNDGSETALDPVLFSDVRDPANNSFEVLETQLVAKVGLYPITYKVVYTSYPANFKVQSTPFTVTIVDPCDSPVSIISPGLADQEYTLT